MAKLTTEEATDYIQQGPGERLYTHPVEWSEKPTILSAKGRKGYYYDQKRPWHRI